MPLLFGGWDFLGGLDYNIFSTLLCLGQHSFAETGFRLKLERFFKVLLGEFRQFPALGGGEDFLHHFVVEFMA